MTTTAFTKSVFHAGRNFLTRHHCRKLFCPRILYSSQQNDDNPNPKEVVISQEDAKLDRPSVRINWKRLKRSWMYYKQYTNFYKNNPAFEDENNLRLRLQKQDEVIYYMRTMEDLQHWYDFS